MMNDEDIEIAAHIIRETDLAYLIDDGTVEAWIPKSLVTFEENSLMKRTAYKTVMITMPEWLAKERGFI